jgi:hypothetical protein
MTDSGVTRSPHDAGTPQVATVPFPFAGAVRGLPSLDDAPLSSATDTVATVNVPYFGRTVMMWTPRWCGSKPAPTT